MNTKFLLFLGCAVVLMAVIRGSTTEADVTKAQDAAIEAIKAYYNAVVYKNATSDAVARAQAAVDKNCADDSTAIDGDLEAMTDALTAIEKEDGGYLGEAKTGRDAAIKAANITDKATASAAATDAETGKNKAVSEASNVNDQKGIAEGKEELVYATCPQDYDSSLTQYQESAELQAAAALLAKENTEEANQNAKDALQRATSAVDACDDAANKGKATNGPLKRLQTAVNEAGKLETQALSGESTASDKKGEVDTAVTSASSAEDKKEFVGTAKTAAAAVVSGRIEAATAESAIAYYRANALAAEAEVNILCPKTIVPVVTSTPAASTAGKNISKSDGTTASNNASVINSGPTSSDSSFNTTPAANSSTNVTDDGNSDRGNYGGEAVTANKWLMLCSTAALFALANFAF